MKIILKPLFELITGELELFDNVIYNYIAMSIVGLIAFWIAWRCVGWLYHEGVIDGRNSGSVFHWIIRTIAFFVTFFIFNGLLWLYCLASAIPTWIWILSGCLVVVVIAVCITIKIRKAKTTA